MRREDLKNLLTQYDNEKKTENGGRYTNGFKALRKVLQQDKGDVIPDQTLINVVEQRFSRMYKKSKITEVRDDSGDLLYKQLDDYGTAQKRSYHREPNKLTNRIYQQLVEYLAQGINFKAALVNGTSAQAAKQRLYLFRLVNGVKNECVVDGRAINAVSDEELYVTIQGYVFTLQWVSDACGSVVSYNNPYNENSVSLLSEADEVRAIKRTVPSLIEREDNGAGRIAPMRVKSVVVSLLDQLLIEEKANLLKFLDNMLAQYSKETYRGRQATKGIKALRAIYKQHTDAENIGLADIGDQVKQFKQQIMRAIKYRFEGLYPEQNYSEKDGCHRVITKFVKSNKQSYHNKSTKTTNLIFRKLADYLAQNIDLIEALKKGTYKDAIQQRLDFYQYTGGLPGGNITAAHHSIKDVPKGDLFIDSYGNVYRFQEIHQQAPIADNIDGVLKNTEKKPELDADREVVRAIVSLMVERAQPIEDVELQEEVELPKEAVAADGDESERNLTASSSLDDLSFVSDSDDGFDGSRRQLELYKKQLENSKQREGLPRIRRDASLESADFVHNEMSSSSDDGESSTQENGLVQLFPAVVHNFEDERDSLLAFINALSKEYSENTYSGRKATKGIQLLRAIHVEHIDAREGDAKAQLEEIIKQLMKLVKERFERHYPKTTTRRYGIHNFINNFGVSDKQSYHNRPGKTTNQIFRKLAMELVRRSDFVTAIRTPGFADVIEQRLELYQYTGGLNGEVPDFRGKIVELFIDRNGLVYTFAEIFDKVNKEDGTLPNYPQDYQQRDEDKLELLEIVRLRENKLRSDEKERQQGQKELERSRKRSASVKQQWKKEKTESVESSRSSSSSSSDDSSASDDSTSSSSSSATDLSSSSDSKSNMSSSSSDPSDEQEVKKKESQSISRKAQLAKPPRRPLSPAPGSLPPPVMRGPQGQFFIKPCSHSEEKRASMPTRADASSSFVDRLSREATALVTHSDVAFLDTSPVAPKPKPRLGEVRSGLPRTQSCQISHSALPKNPPPLLSELNSGSFSRQAGQLFHPAGQTRRQEAGLISRVRSQSVMNVRSEMTQAQRLAIREKQAERLEKGLSDKKVRFPELR